MKVWAPAHRAAASSAFSADRTLPRSTPLEKTATSPLHAASGPMVLTTYEANIKDEAGYTAALPEVEKYIKDNGGQRLAGGFNKAKLIDGTGAVGNRYVIVSWPNAAAFEKAQSDGLKAWIDKHGNGARQIMVEGVEAK